MPEENKNILNIHISNTGVKIDTENLQLNQNSSNNRLFLYCESRFEFVSVYYTKPNGLISNEHHMIPQGWNEDKQSYVYYDDIDEGITSFTIPNQTAQLKVSFIGYSKNKNEQYTPVSVNNSIITVLRVDNSQVLDYTYNGTDVPNIWSKLGEIVNALSVLDPNDTVNVLASLQTTVSNNYNELKSLINAIPNLNDYYTKEELTTMLSSVYKYVGSVATIADLPANLLSNDAGKVYNVEETGINYAWTGTSWDALGSDIDLSQYYNKETTDRLLTAQSGRITTNATNISTLSGELTTATAAIASINTNLNNYYTKSETYSASEINSMLSTVYKYKGSVDNYSSLPSNPGVGDVYNVVDRNNMNYAWTGSKWDELGAIIDMTDYYNKTEIDSKLSGVLTADNVYNKAQIDTKISAINETTNNIASCVSSNYATLRSLTSTVTNNYTTLTSSINTLNSDLKAYTDAKANTNAANLTANINAVNSSISELSTAVANNYTTLDGKITTAKTDIINNVLGPSMTAVNTSLTSLSGRLDGHDTEIENIKTTLSSVYKYKGSVATYETLSTIEGVQTGDVYNVESDGQNYAWNGTTWDSLGALIGGLATQSALEALSSTVTSNFTCLNTAISNAQTTLNGNISSNVNTLNSRITSEVSTINTSISSLDSRLDGKIDTNVSLLTTSINLKANTADVYSKTDADAKFLTYASTISKSEKIVSPTGKYITFDTVDDNDINTYTITSLEDIAYSISGFEPNKYSA